MAIDPIEISEGIKARFQRYLTTALNISPKYEDLRRQFSQAIAAPGRLFRGPYLQGLPPYVEQGSIQSLIEEGVLPPSITQIPFLDSADRPLYQHQAEAIRRLQTGRNVIISSGTGSGKTLAFLAPILAEILENPSPGIHAMLLYPMNALVNDQLKNLRRILKDVPEIRFGRYVNVHVTPSKERDGRRLHPDALQNEVVSREAFREDPPHILMTNYAMLEYLLLRVDDSPLFQGPWCFVVLDEAHTYKGAKGSEIALLLRRLKCRTKGPSGPHPQYIATSATLGSTGPAACEEIASFAQGLFGSPVEVKDVVQSKTEHRPVEGQVTPDEDLYVDKNVSEACQSKTWTDEFSDTLIQAGFDQATVRRAAVLGEAQFEEGLFEVFHHDARVEKLRDATTDVRDLQAAAFHIFGRRDDQAVKLLTGLVRICSQATYPGTDSRLVPCRYHFFVRGLSGAYIAFDQETPQGSPMPRLFLEATNSTPEGTAKTLELRVCRKCGQPYCFGYEFEENDVRVLKSFGSHEEGRGKPVWLTWEAPQLTSIDEEDEDTGETIKGEETSYCATCGAYATGGPVKCSCETPVIHRLWLIQQKAKITRCFACGGSSTVTPLQADAEAAQASVAEAFYRYLPESSNPDALFYPGKGRKLLAFADSRQSAAYFAPYLEHTHDAQKLRWLLYSALKEALDSDPDVGASDLVSFMMTRGEGMFPIGQTNTQKREACSKAVVKEFCLPTGRRQSLEALATMSCFVDLGPFFTAPESLTDWGLTEDEQSDLVQFLLSTIRMQKAMELPPPLSPDDEDFGFSKGEQAFVAKKGDQGTGYRLHAFVPERTPATQRRSAFLARVLKKAAARNGLGEPSNQEIIDVLYEIWTLLCEVKGPITPLLSRQVAPGKTGHQIQWDRLRFRMPGKWYHCAACNQWSPYNVLGVCPSFRCNGELVPKNADEALDDNHYRRIYTAPLAEGPVPLTAREHTAQLTPKLATDYQKAFQDGHSDTEAGQINVLSCSTTFELGVDLGDLEAVLLRDVPPSPANYQQRAGRAGRGVGTAAFVVTFALPRSHDEHYFTIPEEMVSGNVASPRINLTNEMIVRRHAQSVLLADFVRRFKKTTGTELRNVGAFMEASDGDPPIEVYTSQIGQLVNELRDTLAQLVPPEFSESYLDTDLPREIRKSIADAREHYCQEMGMYESARRDAQKRRNKSERDGKHDQARKTNYFLEYLNRRIDSFKREEWIQFFSGRGVLPRYAFPIYNVPLDTSDRELSLDRDLRIALSEYVPGAAIVAKGRLWRSIGIRRPPRRDALDQKHYAVCPQCWHVQRHLDKREVFKGGECPVCGHNGRSPTRRKASYIVPAYGFTTDLEKGGEDLSYDWPMRIPASRVLFVPPQQSDDIVRLHLGESVGASVAVRTTDNADFFVFNNGQDASQKGFSLCQKCGRALERGTGSHTSPMGRSCNGRPHLVHLGHDFRGCAARLEFTGTGREYTDQRFWLSLMYAFLAGTADALGIEASDINGVIRPIRSDTGVTQEVILFDDVPGGAGHVKRLEDQDELVAVIDAAYSRVANCTGCRVDASCYSCLRSYRNQYCHDLLERGLAVDYLERLLAETSPEPSKDREYRFPDKASAIKALLEESSKAWIVADELTASGPPEIGHWHILLQDFCAKGRQLHLAVRQIGASDDDELASVVPVMALLQTGATVLSVDENAPPPPYAILGSTATGRRSAFHWGENRTTVLDSEAHRRPLWCNRSNEHLAEAEGELEAWFKEYATPLRITDIVRGGCKTHVVRKGKKVEFGAVFESVSGQKVASVVLQDPYLVTPHQIKCLGDLLAAIDWVPANGGIPFVLTTRLSNPQLRDRNMIPTAQHREEIESAFASLPDVELRLDLRAAWERIHFRYLLIRLAAGHDILYYLERGLDMEDPKTGLARGDSFILEFSPIPEELKALLHAPSSEPSERH